ncbi:purine-binding chemotaxis protein CheW [Candidatus Magnetomoraceae bacterium gMMP-15]
MEENTNNSQETIEPFIIFELAGATYGVPSRAVQQMEMIDQITPVPDAPTFVDGVVLSRGEVIPAINLRQRFGFEKIPYNLSSRLIVIDIVGRIVGLVVDTAREFIYISSTSIKPPPEEVSGLSGKYLNGIATFEDRLVLILNMEEVLKMAKKISSALDEVEIEAQNEK